MAKFKIGDRVAYETRPWVWMFGTVVAVYAGPRTVPVYTCLWDGYRHPLDNDETELVAAADAVAATPALTK